MMYMQSVARSRQVYINWVVEALLIILSWLGVASDLNTQRLSRQQQADNTLETGNHVLTEITVGTSRPQQAPAGLSRQPKRGLFATQRRWYLTSWTVGGDHRYGSGEALVLQLYTMSGSWVATGKACSTV
jgi:hypothetical protein